MNRNTRKVLIWLVIGGTPPLIVSGLMVLLAFLLLIMITAFGAALFGQGVQFGGQGSSTQQITTSQQWTGQQNTTVVTAALSLVSRLYNCGSENHTQCYTSMPQTDIDLWSSACPPGTGCFPYWQSGDFQCVTFVTGVYHNAGQDVPDAPNAVDFWSDAHFTVRAGWEHISPMSMPEPGDIGVLSGPTPDAAGHVFVITNVVPPSNGKMGMVQFAQGNALVGIATLPLVQQNEGIVIDFSTWPGYQLLGYLRHVS